MHPGVIECSPPRVREKSFLSRISLFISDIFFSAFFIFLSILKGLKVFIPIFCMVHNLVLHHIIQPDEMP